MIDEVQAARTLFPAIKRYSQKHGKPWVRIISCSENEIPDPAIPPHLSGCGDLSRFQIEEMIDPRDTRQLVCEWAEIAHRVASEPDRLRPRALQFRP